MRDKSNRLDAVFAASIAAAAMTVVALLLGVIAWSAFRLFMT